MGRSPIHQRHNIPIEKNESSENVHVHPADRSNWVSFSTFSWMSPFMFSSYKNGLRESEIPNLSSWEQCGRNADGLDELWTREKAFADKPDLGRVLWIYCRRRVYLTTLVYLTSIFLGFLTPTLLMKRVLKFASDSDAERQDGALWITLLILCEFARVFFFTLTWAMSYRYPFQHVSMTAIRVKAACMGLAYRKIFRLGNLSDSAASKLLNVISCDCARIYDVIVSGQVAIGGPVVLILSVGFILYELGWFSLIGMAVFPLAYPLQYLLAKASGSLRKKSIDVKDSRVALIAQAIQNFRFIKMFGWEKHFHRHVSEARDKEIGYLQKSQLLQSWSVVLGPTLPHVGAIVTFILYLNSGNSLSPAQAFCVVALFVGRIRPTLSRTRSGFRSYFESQIAIKRIQCFTILFVFSLLGYSVRSVNQIAELFYSTRITRTRMEDVFMLPEIGDGKKENYGSNTASLSEAVVMEELSLVRRCPPESQQKSEKHSQKKGTNNLSSVEKLLESSDAECNVSFQLDNLNLVIKKGSFVGICGLVGSGKSTFIEGISGSIVPDKGKLNVMGKIAYVAQDPWIFKGTLRENVVFGEDFQSVRYYNTIDSCCLTNDFGILPLGDLTETDEKGSNLSGGQKQRLTLARAIYSESRDIYLLDDPFSGLDGCVAKTIFERVVKGQLLDGSKTVILVTHQLHFLKECDDILVFAEGTVAERGTHDQLMSLNQSHYSNLITTDHIQTGERQQDILMEDSLLLDCKPVDMPRSPTKSRPPESLTSEGKIPFQIYNLYIGNAGGMWAAITVLLAFALSIGSTAFSSWWLKHWFNSVSFPPLTNFRSSDLNDTDGTSENSVLTNDAETVIIEPEVISQDMPDFDFNRNMYAGIIGVIFLTSLFRTILFVYTCIRAAKTLHRRMTTQFFRSTLKASDRLGFGQIFNLFSRDIAEIDTSLPNTLETFLQNIFIVASIFFLVSLVFPVFLGPLVILSGIFVWIRNVYNAAVRDLKRIETNAKTPIFSRVSETMAGLATIRAYGKQKMLIDSYDHLVDDYHSVFYTFVSSVRWLSIRLDFIAVAVTGLTALLILLFHGSVSAASAGLALAYAAQLSGVFQFTVRLASETEAKFVSMERIHKFLTTTPTEELRVDYESDKNLFVSDDEIIPTWPYAGVVKFDAVVLSYSSDMSPALNEVSFEVYAGQKIGIVGRTGSGKSSIGNALFRINELKSGQIIIDEIDIKTLSLMKLREALCVIPQDPSVFQQPIRFNLDPGKEFSDTELWTVLRKVGLKGAVDNLDMEIGLSQGQKQLLSIARALLRNSKVVFVDEATSNVDIETSAIVDRLLAEEFRSSTVFIVAHRLSALSFCDYILIMEDGEVRDFGPVNIITKKPEFILNFEKFESIPL